MTTLQSAEALTEGRWVLDRYVWRWRGECRRLYDAARPAQCGTDAGYYRHRRKFREDACDDCKAAHNKAEREREQRKAMSA